MSSQTTLFASFVNIYRSQLLDPRGVVIVVEDWQQPDEAHKFVSDADHTGYIDTERERVVVGVASWVFPEGSPRAGQFVLPDVGDLEPSPSRDLCQRRLEIFTRISEATEKKYFTGKTVCNKLVVHPSYQRRGHGTSLLRWGQRLSVEDTVDQGVIPAHMGEPVYLSLGYEIIGEMEVPDDGEVKGFSQKVVLYKRKQYRHA